MILKNLNPFVVFNILLIITFSISVNTFVEIQNINLVFYTIFHLVFIYFLFYYYHFTHYLVGFIYGILFDIEKCFDQVDRSREFSSLFSACVRGHTTDPVAAVQLVPTYAEAARISVTFLITNTT